MVQSKLNWCFVKCINSELSVKQSIVAMVLTRGRHSIYVFHIHSLHSADSRIAYVCCMCL